MLLSATGLTGSGLRDWMFQRLTAVVLAMYFTYVLAFFALHQPLDYATWYGLFTQGWFKLASVLALLSVLIHGWIGMWTVYTDYIKPNGVRLVIQSGTVIALLAMMVWGIEIFWGV